MNLEYWANVAEVVGLGLVIVTFIYLSIQIRQSSRSMHAQTAQGIHNTFMEGFKMLCHDDELNRVYRIGILNPEDLTNAEEAKFHAFLGYFTASMYNAHHHHVSSSVDQHVTSSWLEGYKQVYNTPGFRKFWPQRKHFYSSQFIDYVEGVMQESDDAKKASETTYKPFTTKEGMTPEKIREEAKAYQDELRARVGDDAVDKRVISADGTPEPIKVTEIFHKKKQKEEGS